MYVTYDTNKYLIANVCTYIQMFPVCTYNNYVHVCMTFNTNIIHIC